MKSTLLQETLVLSVFIAVCALVQGHVRLSFPPARDLALDFLDNIRTPAPCGMPKGPAKTTLESGSSVNVTWHLGFLHKGNV